MMIKLQEEFSNLGDDDTLDYEGVIDHIANTIVGSSDQLKDWLVTATRAYENGSRSMELKYERTIPGFRNMFVSMFGLELSVRGRRSLDSYEKIRDSLENIFNPPPHSVSLDKSEQVEFLQQLQQLPSALQKVESQLINKSSKVKDAEAPPGAVMGQFAFASNRTDKVPFESNTEIEEELFGQLSNYFTNNVPLKDEDVATLQTFINKGQYSPVIHQPEVPTVYRGMNVRREWLSKVIKKPTSLLGKKGSLEKGFTFAPKNPASSWTEMKSVAKKFTKEDDTSALGERYYSIVMYASIEKNRNKFIACPKGLYKVDAFATYKSEKEALGLGDIKVYKIEWETMAGDDEGWDS